MRNEDRLLESLGLEVSDGRDPVWADVEASLPDGEDRRAIRDLQTVSRIAEFYRVAREDSESTSRSAHPIGDGADGGNLRKAEQPSGAGDNIPFAPGMRWGHLEILEQIGEGSFGAVYRARDTHLEREVALKILRSGSSVEADLPRALIEGERLARVKHPHLVVVHGADRHGGASGIWMEYLRGTTIHSRIREQGPLSDREAIPLGIDLCGALAALHSAGLLHRDVKAQNVIREQGGRIVLMDLGSGAELEGSPDDTTRRVSGTPLYMAPEVMNGSAATARSDIYSLGVLLYYAVSGNYPVTGSSLAELRERHARQERRPLRDLRPDLSSPFVALVERALAPDPGGRFASAGEMERALVSAAGPIPAAAEPAPPPRGSRQPPGPEARSEQRRAVLVPLLGSLAFLALVAVVLFVRPGLLVPASYTVDARLQRLGAEGPETLQSGAIVSPGDRLALEFSASDDLYLYVLAEDDAGASFLLFPLPGHAQGNPLPGGTTHRLPPEKEGRRYSWGVSSAGGTEHVLLVASPEPLTEFESVLGLLATPTMEGIATALPLGDGLRGLRGIGQLLESPPTATSPQPESGSVAFEMARQLGDGSERHRGIWVRQVDLINPSD